MQRLQLLVCDLANLLVVKCMAPSRWYVLQNVGPNRDDYSDKMSPAPTREPPVEQDPCV